MAILVRERELREEVARLTRENTRLWGEVERMSKALNDAARALRAVATTPSVRGGAVVVVVVRAAVEADTAAIVQVPRAASDNAAFHQPAPDVQAALADALLLCVKWMPLAEVRSWPPGFRLREEALAKASAALLLAGRKP